MSLRVLIVVAATAIVATACGGTSFEFDEFVPTTEPPPTTTTLAPVDPIVLAPAATASSRNQTGYTFPAAPATPSDPVDGELGRSLDALVGGIFLFENLDAIRSIAEFDDARASWILADMLLFVGPGETADVIVETIGSLTDTDFSTDPVFEVSSWQSVSDHLIAWDLPSPDDYADRKATLYTQVDSRWQPFFEDPEAAVDWRLVTWGGALIDDRPLGEARPCARGCIPALDDPAVVAADEGAWYPDHRIVFGVTINGESRAYPKNIMEVHEMVNDTLGGRRIAVPYCTLCGSAQAYFVDNLPSDVAQPILRTSGLLSRSNKVMFDLESMSLFDTFTGEAVSGPLRDRAIVLEQISVVTSTWGDWKAAHPDTTIVARDGGIGRAYEFEPLGNRDANGPIFAIGAVDERLSPQTKVLGVITPDGDAVAFDVDAARQALQDGQRVAIDDVVVVADAGGVRAQTESGTPIAAHEAFWFAWSQFHPDTVVWTSQ